MTVSAFMTGRIGIMFSGQSDDFVFLAVNAHWEPHTQELPPLPPGWSWHMEMHTWWKDPFVCESPFDGRTALIGPRSVALFTGVKNASTGNFS